MAADGRGERGKRFATRDEEQSPLAAVAAMKSRQIRPSSGVIGGACLIFGLAFLLFSGRGHVLQRPMALTDLSCLKLTASLGISKVEIAIVEVARCRDSRQRRIPFEITRHTSVLLVLSKTSTIQSLLEELS